MGKHIYSRKTCEVENISTILVYCWSSIGEYRECESCYYETSILTENREKQEVVTERTKET